MPRSPRRAIRSGAAVPWVLLGMGFAALIAVLAWTRAWSHRDRAAQQAATWQAQLLAETALACAEDSVAAMLDASAGPSGASAPGAAATSPSALVAATTPATQQTAPTAPECPLPPGTRGELEYGIGDGKLLIPVTATGSFPFGRRAIVRTIHATLSGALDRALFGAAVTRCPAGNAPLDVSGTRIVGRVRATGHDSIPRSVSIGSYLPTRAIADTALVVARMKEAFAAPDVVAGGAAYSPARRLPERDEIVHASLGGTIEVDLEGPIGGESWTPPEGRTLLVEGDVFVRGRIRLRNWTILASGAVLLEDRAVLEGGYVYAGKGAALRGDAIVSGQILARGGLAVSERAKLSGITVAACGGDSARVVLDGSAASRAYLLAMGPGASLAVGKDAVLEGVAISEGTLRVDGALHGAAVASSYRCGRGLDECTGQGTFDRSRLPADFVVPAGLPGSTALRVAAWSLAP